MLRLVCFRWRPCDGPAERACRARWAELEADRAWSKVIDRRGVLVYVAPSDHDLQPLVLEREEGLIAGALFSRGEGGERSARVTELGAASALKAIETGGRSLIEGYWGTFVALLHDRGRDVLHILRDPIASRPLYVAELCLNGFCIFTHARDYAVVAGEIVCDEGFISAFLLNTRLQSRRTGIVGVREIMPGERLSIGRDTFTIETLWRPKRPKTELGFAAGAAALRQAVLECAEAWSAVSPRLVHRLSGGLDSSIVLGALVAAGAPPSVCFHECPRGFAEGDERRYAALAAAHFGVRLVEIKGDPGAVDYARLADIELSPRPSDTQLSFASNKLVEAGLAAEALIVSSGQGGDHVLHRSRTPAIAADALRDGVALSLQWRIALDTARLARRPVWDVFAAMVGAGALHLKADPLEKFKGRWSLVNSDAWDEARSAMLDHPWARDAARASPARRLRIGHIGDLQYYHQHSNLNCHFLGAPILAMRPVVEVCLSIPPYVMTERGERGLARAAFNDMLPREIVERTSKGATTRYHHAVLERQLPFIREMLIGGELMQRRLVNGAMLEAALKGSVMSDGQQSAAVLTAFVAEMWLRRFENLRAALRARQDRIASEDMPQPPMPAPA